MNVLFSEVEKSFDPGKLNPKAKQVWDNSQNAANPDYEVDPEVRKLFIIPKNLVATYKIELLFGRDRKSEVSSCLLQVFESGGRITEDNDQKCYFCWDMEDRSLGCRGIIPASKLGDSAAVWCSNCNRLVNRHRLTGEIFYRLPMAEIANNIYKIFRSLNYDADIYLKYDKNDMRENTLKGAKGLEPEKLIRAREAAIYPLANIMQDVSNGSDILKKILVFLKV